MKIIGAYDKQNNNYIFPQNASKKRKYYCPDCGEDLIFKKGSIVIPYFSHKSNSKCTYYDHPNESQIHKDAKNKLAQWLKDEKPLKLKIKCSSCNGSCKNKKIKYKDNDKVIVEYISPCKKYIADVAIINNDNVRYVLEVTNTHRTINNAAEVRPEPWFDISADEIVNTDFDKKKVKLNCIRTDCIRFCNDCKKNENLIEQSKELFKNEYVIYLNVPYNEKKYAKKQGAKWDKVKKKWYAPIYEEEKFSRWLNNPKHKDNKKFQQKNKNGSCKNCGKFNDNHIYSDYCDLCKNDKNALKLEINKYIRKRSY